MSQGQLVVLKGAESHLQQVFLLSKEQDRLLGRSSMCHFRLVDPLASSMHCVFCYRDGKYVVKDLLSANGVLVGDDLVDTQTLGKGMTIQVGKTVLEYSLYEGKEKGKTYITGDKTDFSESPMSKNGAEEESHSTKVPLGRMIQSHRDLSICRVAIKNDLLTHKQIREALAESQQRKIPDVVQVLTQRSILDEQDVENLWHEHNYYKVLNKDMQLAKIAIDSKAVDEEKINECLALQKRYFEETEQLPRLGELLVQKGYITIQINNFLIKELVKRRHE